MKQTKTATSFGIKVSNNQLLFETLQDILFKRGLEWNGTTGKNYLKTTGIVEYIYFDIKGRITYSSTTLHLSEYGAELTLEEFVSGDYVLAEPKQIKLNSEYN